MINTNAHQVSRTTVRHSVHRSDSSASPISQLRNQAASLLGLVGSSGGAVSGNSGFGNPVCRPTASISEFLGGPSIGQSLSRVFGAANGAAGH